MSKTALLPTYYIMDVWSPYEEGNLSWTWGDEINRLRETGQLHALAGEVMQDQGFGKPVQLGGDGRVWEGQDRVVAAYMKGVTQLPVLFAHIEPT